MFNPGSTSPSILEGYAASFCYWIFTIFDCAFQHIHRHHRYPISLAATDGVAIAFLSSGYLDVSVPQVRFAHLCIQCTIPLRVGFPIQTSIDHSLVTGSL
jgi:hypothetical protein